MIDNSEIFVPELKYGEDYPTIPDIIKHHNIKLDLKSRVAAMIRLLNDCSNNFKINFCYTVRQAEKLCEKCEKACEWDLVSNLKAAIDAAMKKREAFLKLNELDKKLIIDKSESGREALKEELAEIL